MTAGRHEGAVLARGRGAACASAAHLTQVVPRPAARSGPVSGRAPAWRRAAPLAAVLALLLGALYPFAATAQEIVAANWACTPSGVGPGQSFRLLFVTSTTTQATSADIDTYHSFVQTRAATNSCFTTAQANKFRAFIATKTTAAKSNTATTGTGVPIYWMKGAKVADNYGDFFDDSWNSNAAKNESGASRTGRVWTGTFVNGDPKQDQRAGDNLVSWGDPSSSSGMLLEGSAPNTNSYRLLAFSPVFQVQPKPAKPTGLSARAGDRQVALRWTNPSDSSITKYQLQQKAGEAAWGEWGDISGSGASTTSHTVTGLMNGTEYRFRIRAVNSGGNSDESDEAFTVPSAVPPPPTAQTVPHDWPLIPAGVEPGDSFRLLFVTSTYTSAASTVLSTYNTFVQGRAAANANLAGFSGQFRALISTSVDARDNTATTGTGVPIYWVGGDKVADDYADLYDGSWDSEAGRTETGAGRGGHLVVWTGSNADGTRHAKYPVDGQGFTAVGLLDGNLGGSRGPVHRPGQERDASEYGSARSA